MSVHELLELALSPPTKSIEGYWQAIQLRPDFAAGELLNIGVLFRDKTGVAFRLLNSFDKFSHLYGETAEDELRFIMRALAGALKNSSAPHLPSVEFGQPRLAKGDSVEEILGRLYGSTVTLSGPVHMVKKQRAKFFNNSWVRDEVFGLVKLKAGLAADSLFASDDRLLFQSQGTLIPLDIPLRPNNLLGSVVSAGFASHENVERALLRAFVDLMTGLAIVKPREAKVFVFHPTDISDTDRRTKIENVIDMAKWKLNKVGLGVTVAEKPEALAEDILNWSGVS